MKMHNVRARQGHRYLRRESGAGRTRQHGYLESFAAVCHQDGTTHAAERRHWPYWGRWTRPELDQIRRDAKDAFDAFHEAWGEEAS